MIRVAIFLVVSIGFFLISWRSLREPRSHGFYRFFAFEFLLLLILRNSPFWFRDPLSPHQIISWLLLFGSLWLAVEGFRLLLKIGKPTRDGRRGTKLAFESTTTLVTVGLYRYIRHPMYAALLALAWGTCLKHVSIASVGLALSACGFLIAMVLAEERENLADFGADYAAYMKTTKRFIPWVF